MEIEENQHLHLSLEIEDNQWKGLGGRDWLANGSWWWEREWDMFELPVQNSCKGAVREGAVTERGNVREVQGMERELRAWEYEMGGRRI